MFIIKSKFEILMKNIDHLNEVLTRNQVIDLVEILGDRKKLLVRNFFSGIAKGVGLGIGVTVITAILVILLQKIVKLNIPIIGEYITDIVEIVEKNRSY